MAPEIKIVRTDAELECPGIDAGLRARGRLVLLPDGIAEAALAAEAADAELLLTCYAPVSEAVIGGAKKLKGIVKYGVGIDAIDIAAASARGIPVVNVPAYAEETVAEAAFALMIALMKKLPAVSQAMQREGWVWPTASWLGRDLAGKTLGLVGVGRIARSLARMAGPGFRMRVVGYDPYVGAEAMRDAGVEKREALHALLSEADVVSVHAVLSPATRHLIGEAEFARMKPSAFFINTARGAIADEAALLRALEAGRIAGAGLDVFAAEPLAKEGHSLSRLYAMQNVVLLPHLAFYTDEAMRRLEQETLERCYEILDGRPVLVKSTDPRLTAQRRGVTFGV